MRTTYLHLGRFAPSSLTMLSCFMCGRSASVVEATTPHKRSPSLEESKLSKDVKGDHHLLLQSITKSNLNVSSDVKDGDLKPSALAKTKNPRSLKHAASHNSTPPDNGSVCAVSAHASDCCTTQKDVGSPAIVVKEGCIEECTLSCTTPEVEPDDYSTEYSELVRSSDDESCSEVRNKDSMRCRQDVFGKNATVNAGNDVRSCRYQMLEKITESHYRNVSSKSTCGDTVADADGEIIINANSNEDTSSTTDVNAEKPFSQHEAHKTNGIVLMDSEQDIDKGVKSYKRKQPARLFSYGISDQQRDFLFLCAGLVIQAVGFQLKSIVEVVTALILVGYRAYFFASRFVDSLSHMRERLKEVHTKLLSYVATQDYMQSCALHMEKLQSMKPLLIAGAKKLGWGCITAAFVLALLIVLLFISFVFSYFAVKGSSRQEAPLHIRKDLFFDYTKSHPVASLDLLSLDAYHKSNASRGGKLNAMARVRYRSTLILTLPESDYNRKLGIFQVTSELLSETGDILSKASKPCMLHFKSTTSHYAKSICLAIPIIVGVTSETQTLSLQLLEWQQDAVSPATSASVIRIMLAARAGRAISTGLPELYKAEIQVDSYGMSSSASTIRTLLLWVGLSFMLFGFLSTFCMYKIHHKRNSS